MSTEITATIFSLFKKYGHIVYGEKMNVSSHSIQSGLIAKEKGYDEELILSAFLHDVGHLYPLELEDSTFEKMGEYGIEQHDKWGAVLLEKLGFSARLIAPVKNHVDAKRYLCYANKSYYNELTEASKQTLEYQGGPMTSEEAAKFEADPYFEDSILIRRIDEEAKVPDFVITDEHWQYFSELLGRIQQ